MLANVRQGTIKPIITAAVTPSTLIHTDEYGIYARLPAWGYRHKTICHGRGEYARDEDGRWHLRGARQHNGGVLVLAALLAAPAPGHLAGQTGALPRLLPVRATHADVAKPCWAPSSPAWLRDVPATTPEPDKSL